MSTAKITDLTAQAAVGEGNEIPLWDDVAAVTKKVTLANLRSSLNPGAISTVDDVDLTASRALASNGSGKVAVATATLSELQGLHGLTASRALATDGSGILTPSGATAAELAGLHALTASRALATDGSGILTPSAVTAAELAYLSGVTAAIQTQLNALATYPVINLVANGNMNHWDLGPTPTVVDNSYFAPGWRYLTNSTANRAASRGSASPPAGSQYFVSVDGSGAASQTANAIFFVLRSEDSIPLRGKTVTLMFQFQPNGTDSTVINVAIATWTGAADAVTADPISAYSPGPTFIANWTDENASQVSSSGSPWINYVYTAVLDTASFNNIGIYIAGIRNSVGARGRYDLTQIQLYVGTAVTNFVHRPVQDGRNQLAKHNYEATAAPGVSDDITLGYALGSNWINVTADDHYINLDPTAGAAVWKKTTP